MDVKIFDDWYFNRWLLSNSAAMIQACAGI